MNPVTETFEMIERYDGVLSREDLLRLASRLRALPRGTKGVLLDWGGVTHVDFRGIEPVLDELRALTSFGIAIRLAGIDPYLFSILRLSASGEDEFERFLGTAERAERVSAEGRSARRADRVPWWLMIPVSKN
jgi:hypothetical protein